MVLKNEERDDLLLDIRKSLDRLESYVLAMDHKVNGLEVYVKAMANSLLSPSEITAIERSTAEAAAVETAPPVAVAQAPSALEAARVDTRTSSAVEVARGPN